MNLYLITQTTNRGYDTYDSAVVCAESEEAARYMLPEGEARPDGYGEIEWPCAWVHGWANSPADVTAKLIGVADPSVKPGTVCASFNAG